jgi:hypothetical protein
VSAKSDEIPYEKCVNTYFCISSKASLGKWSFLTLNLQNFVMLNKAAGSKFKGKHSGNFGMAMDKSLLSL